ncbi:MAG TPA: flavodoxin family protein [Candidatus Limnocylindrales bacterium]
MKTGVIYGSHTGNTREVAEAIAAVLRAHGPVELLSIEEAQGVPTGLDLLLIGSPTEAHGIPKDMVAFLDRLPADAVLGVAAAAFDTRVAWPRFLSGSAAAGIEGRLRGAGARIVCPGESFIVSTAPELKPGELERASTWATRLVEIVHPAATSLPV